MRVSSHLGLWQRHAKLAHASFRLSDWQLMSCSILLYLISTMGGLIVGHVLQASIYRHLADLQGRALPILRAAGWYMGNIYGLLAMDPCGSSANGVALTSEDIACALTSLKAIHDRSVLHRDIAPRNFLLSSVEVRTPILHVVCLHLHIACMDHDMCMKNSYKLDAYTPLAAESSCTLAVLQS